MSKDFIKLKDTRYGDVMTVNVNNIIFYERQRTIVVSGMNLSGYGVIEITQESANRLSKMLEERLWGADDE